MRHRRVEFPAQMFQKLSILFPPAKMFEPTAKTRMFNKKRHGGSHSWTIGLFLPTSVGREPFKEAISAPECQLCLQPLTPPTLPKSQQLAEKKVSDFTICCFSQKGPADRHGPSHSCCTKKWTKNNVYLHQSSSPTTAIQLKKKKTRDGHIFLPGGRKTTQISLTHGH